MKSWKKPTDEMVDKTLKLVKKGTGSRYFFSRLKNPLWIQPLVEHGYFQSPPSKIKYFDDYSDDVYVQYPSWPELQYLKNVSCDVPDEVVNLVLGLPKVDNLSVYNDILEIALQLDGEQSARLKPKILESTDINDRLLARKYADLLAHWIAEHQTSAALELSKILVEFAPDPQSKAKEKRRRKNSTDFGTFYETSLKPSPRIGGSEYREIMSKGVRPLARKEPYQVARFLIDATTNMIRLRMHQEELDQGVDSSEIWYERLNELDTGYEDSDKTLVHTLTFACEQVYEKSPDSIVILDKVLRNQQWKVFKRLRQHLYAQYPNEQTKPWIRELILKHKEYYLWEHRYEFQWMIRSACEHFGETLLTEAERAQIFDSIRRGPSKTDYQSWVEGWGEEFTEERFQQYQHNFHWKQFKPFESVLFGEYVTYFRELEDKATVPISAEDYPPTKTRSGYVSTRSPCSPEDLAAFTDEELLSYLNEWEGKEFLSKGNLLVEINIEGLAKAFQTVFKETIIPDANRLRFWMENRDEIQRPIYVRMMINGMQKDVKEKNFDRLNEWLTFGEWVLSHPDQKYESDYSLGIQGDESRTRPNWHNSRRVVDHFIEACLEEDVPISARGQLAKLLTMLCTQFDSRLDNGEQTFPDQNDLLNEGFNNTRSCALQTLVGFAFWLGEHDSTSGAPELIAILEKRFAPQAEYPVTLPEYAILGSLYPRLLNLNKEWTIGHKSDFFPQDKLPKWLAAFSTFICSNDPHKLTFEIFRDDFTFALEYLADHKKENHIGKEWIETLGQHLFTYYLWGLYLLRGSTETDDRCSPLERYYQATEAYPEHWANLFYYVGDFLWKTKQLNTDMKNRIFGFFNWRFEEDKPNELQQFTLWLEAECLEPEWAVRCLLPDFGILVRLKMYQSIFRWRHYANCFQIIQRRCLNVLPS